MDRRFKRPIVAAYVTNTVFNKLLKQKDRKYIKVKLLAAANQLAQTTLYFFSYGGVDFVNEEITGIYYDAAQKRWIPGCFPYPDVFYDRIGMNTSLRRQHLELVRTAFAQKKVKTINSRHFFDKWELYLLFKQNELLRPHLPETRCFNTTGDLVEMLNSHNHIYIKGRTGCRGKEVMSVKLLPDGSFECKYHRGLTVVRQVIGIDQLQAELDLFFRVKNLLVQEAIQLVQYDGRIADIRGEVQRNGHGDLEVTAIPARLGKKSSPVATHGTCCTFEEFCRDYLEFAEETVTDFRAQTENFLKTIYTCVEQNYGPFGEIGIDIGLDCSGKIWVIECNSKSGKVSLCNSSSAETVQKAFLNPLEYARHLYSLREV